MCYRLMAGYGVRQSAYPTECRTVMSEQMPLLADDKGQIS